MVTIAGMTDQFSLPGFDAPRSPPPRVKAAHAQRPRHGLFFGTLPTPDDLSRVEATASPLRLRHGTTRGLVKAERLHVTCCDLGSFREAPPQDLVDAAMAVAAGLVLQSFEIVFERVLRFKGNQALVLLEREGVTHLSAFCEALGQALVRGGVPVDIVGTPHMTLGYGGAAVSETLREPLRWMAPDFVLVHSLVGQGEHRHLGRWPLAPRR